jgi:hypothetical protein
VGPHRPLRRSRRATEEASKDALALVVCTVIFVSATVMFFCGALIVCCA